jgi:hypothetical protein
MSGEQQYFLGTGAIAANVRIAMRFVKKMKLISQITWFKRGLLLLSG